MDTRLGTEVISRLQDLIIPCAASYDVVPEHWIHGWDEGLSFCFECAEKKVAELLKEESDGDYLAIPRRFARHANGLSTTRLLIMLPHRRLTTWKKAELT